MEEHILKVIQSWGFESEKIVEDNKGESPDFLVDDGQFLYLVEFKERGDDDLGVQEREKALRLGNLYEEHIPLVPQNRLSGIIRKVQSQLDAKKDVQVDFRIAWLAATGRNQAAKYERFFATLYGSINIFELNCDHLKPCYFFRNSDFFRYRNVLDGAILSWNDNAIFCLNPYSPNNTELKASALCTHFGTAVRDPLEQEKNGEAYFADCDIDRAHTQGVLDYLRAKYHKDQIMTMDMGYHSATVTVPHDNNS